MDLRWQPFPLDSKRDARVYLHPTASIGQVRRGEATDAFDLSPYLSAGTHTTADCTITLNWNLELFGPNQPKPNQILEVQLLQDGVFLVAWIGVVETLSNVTLSRGQRSMTITARSRETQDIWKETKRVTALFPQLTDLGYIALQIAKTAGLEDDEVDLPLTSFTTAHTNTQLSDMTAWDMLQTVFLPLGWTPFFDSLGRLRAANRELQNAQADVLLTSDRVVNVNANRQRPPATRVRLLWLDPVLKRSEQQGRSLWSGSVTMGWFLPYWKQTIYFSDDRTQRAEDTYLKIIHSANSLFIPFCDERYIQEGENFGKVSIVNFGFIVAVIAMITAWYAAHRVPDGVAGTSTVPIGRKLEGEAQLRLMLLMMAIGTGTYEVWGYPYDWVHARNTTEAFDTTAPSWADKPVEINSDFIMNEQHAQAVATRELIYQAKSANKWTVTLVDDPRYEQGDILQFSDGTRLYIEDFTRSIMRGSDATIQVSGFLIGGNAVARPPVTDPVSTVMPVAPPVGLGPVGPSQPPVIPS